MGRDVCFVALTSLWVGCVGVMEDPMGTDAAATPDTGTATGDAATMEPDAWGDDASFAPDASAPLDGGAPPPADAASVSDASTVTYTCTQLHGAAQSRDWFIDGVFESYVGAGTWQRIGGTGINHWRRAGDPVWDETPMPPCAANGDAPDRIVQVLWGHTTFTTDEWERNIRQARDVALAKYPSVRTYVPMPAAGLDGCPGSYASEQNPRIVDAIARVAADTPGVEAGPLIALESCADIESPSLDRLTDDAARRVAAQLGDYFD